MNRRAVVAAAALAPAFVYEFVEIAKGDTGWPYSRFIRLIPMPVRVAALTGVTAWAWPHLIKDPLKTIVKELS